MRDVEGATSPPHRVSVIGGASTDWLSSSPAGNTHPDGVIPNIPIPRRSNA